MKVLQDKVNTSVDMASVFPQNMVNVTGKCHSGYDTILSAWTLYVYHMPWCSPQHMVNVHHCMVKVSLGMIKVSQDMVKLSMFMVNAIRDMTQVSLDMVHVSCAMVIVSLNIVSVYMHMVKTIWTLQTSH
jgi:hypothetical protein